MTSHSIKIVISGLLGASGVLSLMLAAEILESDNTSNALPAQVLGCNILQCADGSSPGPGCFCNCWSGNPPLCDPPPNEYSDDGTLCVYWTAWTDPETCACVDIPMDTGLCSSSSSSSQNSSSSSGGSSCGPSDDHCSSGSSDGSSGSSESSDDSSGNSSTNSSGSSGQSSAQSSASSTGNTSSAESSANSSASSQQSSAFSSINSSGNSSRFSSNSSGQSSFVSHSSNRNQCIFTCDSARECPYGTMCIAQCCRQCVSHIQCPQFEYCTTQGFCRTCSLRADFNKDGVVNPIDFFIMFSNFGRYVSNGHALGDANQNGYIYYDDYSIWLDENGQSCPI